MTLDCDVAVIGLGPAGAAAAIAAAEAGLRVIGLDRKARAGEPVQCAELVPALFAQNVQRVDAIAQPIAAMHTYLEAEPRHVAANFPGCMISRAQFDASQVARARSAGAQILLGHAVRSFTADGEIVLADGRVLSARIIVGADGPHSRVGAAAGRRNTAFVETRQITAPLRTRHDATDIFLRASIPGGYGWLFPKRDVAHVGVGLDASARTRLKPELERLRTALIAQGRIGEDILAATGGAIPVSGMLDPLATLGGRPVLLVGDAAGLANPITGAGIASAFMSGTLAGQAAPAWIQGAAHALGDYREEVHDLFAPSLTRALQRRATIMAIHQRGQAPSLHAQRAAWIAFPNYWSTHEEKAYDLLEA